MSYQATLAEMVEKSGLTLRDISKRCKEYHVKVDPSYISKLQSTKHNQPPASEDVTRAIAMACGGDPDQLLFEGYMEKGPDLISDIIGKLSNQFRTFAKSHVSKAGVNQAPILEDIANRVSDWTILQMAIEHGLGLGLVPLEQKTEKLLGSDEEIEIITNELFRITMLDSSMEPVIPKNAKVQLDSSIDISNGDIVVAGKPHQPRVIRKCIMQRDKILLVPINKNYEIEELHSDEVTIYGKVKELITEL